MIMSYLANLEMSYSRVAIIVSFKGGFYGRKGHYHGYTGGVKESAHSPQGNRKEHHSTASSGYIGFNQSPDTQDSGKDTIRGGDNGVIHRLRGSPSNRRLAYKDKALRIFKTKYPDFGPTLASEKLFERDKIKVNDETLRLWLINEGIPYKKRKKRPHRQWRQRRHYFGEMIQMDGSDHDWLEGRGPKLIFMGYIDDATGMPFGRFYEYEGTIPAMDSFKRYIQKYGIPNSIYIDKHAAYKSKKKPSIEDELSNKDPMTQFTRAMEELGVEVIYANSPQAKGRIERLFNTFQDRLIKELRLEKANTIIEANKVTARFLPKYAKRFSVKASREGDLHRPIPKEHRVK